MGWLRFGPQDEGQDLGPPPGVFRFQRRPSFRVPGGALRWGVLAVALIVLFIIADIAKGIFAEWLWFDSVDYLSVYRLRIVTRIWLFFTGGGVFLLFFGANVLIAARMAASGERLAISFGDAEPAAVRRLVIIGSVTAALLLAVIFGGQAAGQWQKVLLYINSQSFGQDDPVFHQDIGFYVFRLPLLNFIVAWSLAAAIVTTIAVAALYTSRLLLGGSAVSVPRAARPHVSLLLVIVIALFIWRYWLVRYGLLYSERGPVTGAAYTDLHAQLPVIYVLMGFGAVTAVAILASLYRRALVALPLVTTALWVVAGIIGGLIYPATVQRFQVEPNELSVERTYIQRNIEATRAAYGLDSIDERPFPARASVSTDEVDANPETIQNIRLWDHRPLLQTLDQIQTIRPLYDFLGVDVDRYVIDGDLRQVMLSARELNPDRLPEDAQSWVNRRLQFTHGFGLAMVPVNEVVQEGLPDFFVSDIPPAGALPVDEPRIYFGEMPDHYVLVNSDEEEFDYPIGEEAAKTAFSGEGGIKLSSFWRRFVYAWEFTDTNILISSALSDDSRLLYRRNIQQRIHEIAPFLQLDFDPYLVLADGKLFWVQDAYTITNRYPYSTPSGAINYIRNSVKITVNAYDGSVTFYLVDPNDPIARAYDGIYPDLFTPFDAMPPALREHLRYPEQLFRTQAQLYRTYHIRQANALYNREDLWDIPTEVFVDQQQVIEPYYVIMRIPGEPQEEFVLFVPFRPANRNNTIAWLAARSDAENYGKLLSFRFPTDALVFGPSQIESRIDQDTAISQQFSLWNQSGSQVIRGNLLMIPIGEGNLFVEPIYLQATAGQLPELKRVVVVNGNSIAMEPTLGRALAVVFGRAEPTTPTTEGPTPASPTPGPGETPAPTPTAQPTSELPDDIAQLISDANDSFDRAQALLQQGDFAGYGEEIDRLEEILQRLGELTEGP